MHAHTRRGNAQKGVGVCVCVCVCVCGCRPEGLQSYERIKYSRAQCPRMSFTYTDAYTRRLAHTGTEGGMHARDTHKGRG